ncbi:MAG TPA: hypothetical protein VN045_06145 [Microbacteriaceae bacterium]|nr:hypothetical protein [Microbacteriaceae bacterium]
MSESIAHKLFQRSNGKPGPVRKVARDATSAAFSIKNLLNSDLMRFRVNATPADSDTTSVRVTITYFTTLQRKMMGIPTEPKRLGGWLAYSTFLETLKASIQDADASARSSIVEAVG